MADKLALVHVPEPEPPPEEGHEAASDAFRAVLAALAADPALDQRFASEYGRLLEALTASHASERALLGRLRALGNELQSSAGRLAHAVTLAGEDARTIDELRARVDAADADAVGARAREAAATQAAERAAAAAAGAADELARHAELLGQHGSIEALLAERDALQQAQLAVQQRQTLSAADAARCDELGAEIAARQARLEETRTQQQRDAERALAAATAGAERDAQRAASLEDEAARLRAQVAAAEGAAVKLRAEAAATAQRLAAAERQVAAGKADAATSAAELQAARNAARKLQDQADTLQQRLDGAVDERARLQRELHAAGVALSAEKSRCAGLAAAAGGGERERARLRSQLDAAIFDAARLRAQVGAQQKQLEAEVRAGWVWGGECDDILVLLSDYSGASLATHPSSLPQPQAAAIRDRERDLARQEADKAALGKKLVAEAQKAADGRTEAAQRAAEVAALQDDRRCDELELVRLRSDEAVLERDRERLRQQVRVCGRLGLPLGGV